MESLFTIGMFLGGLISLIAYVWLVIVAFKEGGALWGIVVLLTSWIGGLIFCIVKGTGWTPFIVMIAGMITASGSAVLSFPGLN